MRRNWWKSRISRDLFKDEHNDLQIRGELRGAALEVDKVVAGLYGIMDEELDEVRKMLGVLKGENGER